MDITDLDEQIYERCESITAKDAEYQALVAQAYEAYSVLQKSLREYINTTAKLQAYTEKLMLCEGIRTAHLTAQNKTNPNYLATANK